MLVGVRRFVSLRSLNVQMGAGSSFMGALSEDGEADRDETRRPRKQACFVSSLRSSLDGLSGRPPA